MKTFDIEHAVMERVREQQWLLNPYKDLANLVEEVGELSREIRRIEDGRGRPDEINLDEEMIMENLALEIGDVLFPLIKISQRYGISLEQAFKSHQKKMDERYKKGIGGC